MCAARDPKLPSWYKFIISVPAATCGCKGLLQTLRHAVAMLARNSVAYLAALAVLKTKPMEAPSQSKISRFWPFGHRRPLPTVFALGCFALSLFCQGCSHRPLLSKPLHDHEHGQHLLPACSWPVDIFLSDHAATFRLICKSCHPTPTKTGSSCIASSRNSGDIE